MKHGRKNASYIVLTKRVKLQHEKKPVLNVISKQSVGFEQTIGKLIKIFIPQE